MVLENKTVKKMMKAIRFKKEINSFNWFTQSHVNRVILIGTDQSN